MFGVARLVGAVFVVDNDAVATAVAAMSRKNHLSEFLNRPNPRNDKLRRSWLACIGWLKLFALLFRVFEFQTILYILRG